MFIDISTQLPCCFDQAVAHVKKPELLHFVAAPLIRFSPINPVRFPDVWLEQTYWVHLYLFGLVPFGKQAIVITMPLTKNSFALRDAGHSSIIKTWDHVITIRQVPHGITYRDQVEVKAGLLTAFIWMFAQLFYRHRQRRWRALVPRAFKYGDV